MLTSDEVRLLAYATALRIDEDDTDHWFCPEIDLFAEAMGLVQRGYLHRRWHAGDMVFRLSDQALTAQLATNLTASAAANAN